MTSKTQEQSVMDISRIWVIARNVFREVIRDRILYLVAFYAVVMVLAISLLREVAAGTQNKLFLDLGLTGIHILGLIVAVFLGTGLVNKEIEKRTVLVLVAKPVSRVEFVLGKHVGLTAVLVVLTVLLTVIYLALLSYGRIEYSLTSLLLAIGFNVLELMLITAAALLFGVFTSSLLAVLLTLAVYFMGHLSEDIVTLGQITENPGFERLSKGMYLVLPDLERLNLRNEAIYGLNLLPSSMELLTHAVYAGFYIALLLTIATAIFARRQF